MTRVTFNNKVDKWRHALMCNRARAGPDTRSSVTYHIPIISCLSNVLFTWLWYGTTLDSFGALNHQIFAETIRTYMQPYIHSYIHDPSPFSIDCWTPTSRLRRWVSVWISKINFWFANRRVLPWGIVESHCTTWTKLCPTSPHWWGTFGFWHGPTFLLLALLYFNPRPTGGWGP